MISNRLLQTRHYGGFCVFTYNLFHLAVVFSMLSGVAFWVEGRRLLGLFFQCGSIKGRVKGFLYKGGYVLYFLFHRMGDNIACLP